MIFVLVAATILGLAASYIARRFYKNPFLWFGLAFLFGILAILALLVVIWKDYLMEKKEAGKGAELKEQKKPPRDLTPFKEGFWYYLDREESQKGPMSLEALASAFESGELSKKSYIWHEKMADWRVLKEVGPLLNFLEEETTSSP